MVNVATTIEHHLGDALLFGQFGNLFPNHLRRRYVSARDGRKRSVGEGGWEKDCRTGQTEGHRQGGVRSWWLHLPWPGQSGCRRGARSGIAVLKTVLSSRFSVLSEKPENRELRILRLESYGIQNA